MLGVLADMCAQTMLRLRAEAQSANRAAQLEFLADASQALATSLDYRQTLRQVASLAVPAHADWCSVQMVDDGVLRTLAVAHIDPDKVQLARELETRWPPDPDRQGGAAHVARTGESLLVENVTDEMLVASAQDDEHLRVARELGLQSAMSVPLVAKDRVLGRPDLRRGGVRTPLHARRRRLRRGPRPTGGARHRQRRPLLPDEARRVGAPGDAAAAGPARDPGWQIGTVYRQAGRTDVGGDYYDVSGLDDGRVTVVLGDVMGRGVDAAVAGSRMRSAARVLATQDPEPDALAGAMDRFMATEPPTQMASSVYLLFEPARDDLALVVAGHPPPLLVSGGRTRFVTEDGSPVHGLGEIPRLGRPGALRRRRPAPRCTRTDSSSAAVRASTSGSNGCRSPPRSCSRTSGTTTDLDDVLAELAEVVSDPDRHDDVAVLAFRRLV